jgi:hypothetical protein
VSAPDPYPPGPPGTPPGPSDQYFEGLTYGRATNAMWLGVASVLCCGLLAGVPAIYVGSRALSDIDASRGRLKGKGTAWAGIILGILGILGTFGGAGYVYHQSQSGDCEPTGSSSHAGRIC